MQHFNLRGEQVNKGMSTVALREGCGVLFEGKDLQPGANPHVVPTWFAHGLVQSGRARIVEDAPPAAAGAVVNADPAPTVREPVAQNRDPKPRGNRGTR